MAGTEVTTIRMTETAKQVEEIIVRYENSVKRLKDIGSELDLMWEGDASNKFTEKFSQDQARFAQLKELLKAYTETLRQDAGIYEKAEHDVLEVLNTNKTR